MLGSGVASLVLQHLWMFLWSSVAAKALSLSAGAAAFTQSSQGLLVATVIIISMTMPAPQVSRGVILVPCCDGTLAPQVSHGIPTMFQFWGSWISWAMVTLGSQALWIHFPDGGGEQCCSSATAMSTRERWDCSLRLPSNIEVGSNV